MLAEDYRTGIRRHIVSAYFTFVGTDEHGRPAHVPKVIPETSDEIRRYEEAGKRRERRHQASRKLTEK